MRLPILFKAFVTAIALAGALIAHAEDIRLRSGNGTVGGLDAQIHFASLSGPFTATDFAAARSGNAATIVSRFDDGYGGWLSGLAADPAAQWIAVDANRSARSALYAQDFNVATSEVGKATLDLSYAVDNYLGAGGVPGLYLNGIAIIPPGNAGGFNHEYSLSAVDVTAAIRPGLNTLYFFQYDFGVVAGSLYSAKINVQAVPEPAPLAVLGLGALTLTHRRRRG